MPLILVEVRHPSSRNLSAGSITQAEVATGSTALSRGSSQAKTRPLLPMETTLTRVIKTVWYMERFLIYLSRITTPHQERLLSSSSVHEDCIILGRHQNYRRELLTTRGRSCGARSESWIPRTWPYLAQEPTVIHAAGYIECPNS